MSVDFVLATKTKVDAFKDSASINDIVKYVIDCTPWQDDNSPITAATWTNQGSGNLTISSQTLVGGVISALVNFQEAGENMIKIVLTTATQTKTIWLDVFVKDLTAGFSGDDYSYGT